MWGLTYRRGRHEAGGGQRLARAGDRGRRVPRGDSLKTHMHINNGVPTERKKALSSSRRHWAHAGRSGCFGGSGSAGGGSAAGGGGAAIFFWPGGRVGRLGTVRHAGFAGPAGGSSMASGGGGGGANSGKGSCGNVIRTARSRGSQATHLGPPVGRILAAGAVLGLDGHELRDLAGIWLRERRQNVGRMGRTAVERGARRVAFRPPGEAAALRLRGPC